jgi:hypothetical protein
MLGVDLTKALPLRGTSIANSPSEVDVADTRDEHSADPMIPGERDPRNLTHREPGAVGGQFTGADIPAGPAEWLDDVTMHERVREGGGADGERAAHKRERNTDAKA